MLLDLIIGREGNVTEGTSVLKVATTDGKTTKNIGQKGTVPQTVSHNHLKLTINDDQTCKVENISNGNTVYVNGQSVKTKFISIGDKVELGESRYPLDWDVVKSMIPKVIDITPLKKIYERYEQENKAINRYVTRINVLAGAPMVFTMLGGLLMTIFPDHRVTLSIFTGIALLITIFGLVMRWRVADVKDRKQKEVQEWFQGACVCPQCKRFLGANYRNYFLLSQNTACPFCKTKIGKK